MLHNNKLITAPSIYAIEKCTHTCCCPFWTCAYSKTLFGRAPRAAPARALPNGCFCCGSGCEAHAGAGHSFHMGGGAMFSWLQAAPPPPSRITPPRARRRHAPPRGGSLHAAQRGEGGRRRRELAAARTPEAASGGGRRSWRQGALRRPAAE